MEAQRIRAAHAIVVRTADALAVALPKPVADAIAEAERIQAATGGITTTVEDLAAAAVTAIREGRDPLADAGVQRLATGRQLVQQNIGEAGRAHATELIGEALFTHADTILAGWGKVADKAGRVLADTVDLLPADLSDARAVLKAGAPAAQAWAKAGPAVEQIEQAVTGFAALGRLAFAPLGATHARTLQMADVDLDTAEELRRGLNRDDKITPWTLTRAGVPIAFPTLTDYRKRVAAHEDERKRRAQQAEQGSRGRVGVIA